MTTSIKKLLLVSVTLLLGMMSIGVTQAQTNYDFSVSVNGSTYDLITTTATYESNPSFFSPAYMPWWGNRDLALDISLALGSNLGTPNTVNNPNYDPRPVAGTPFFAINIYTGSGSPYGYEGFYIIPNIQWGCGGCTTAYFNDNPIVFAVLATAGSGVAPEMNASLIPQVGLLLACLFFLFGRKKENTEPMLTA